MQIYRATHIETGEIIEGGARDLARKLGVVTKSIYNAVALQQKIKYVWFISTEKPYRKANSKSNDKTNRVTPQLLDEWEKVTEPFKKASQKGRKKGNSKIRLRTRYNVGVY
jgi:hypothetical protein